MTPKKINIILVDDNVRFRTNLKNYIESELNCSVISEAADGVEFLDLPNKHLADIILMDIVMENMDGFEATKKALWLDRHLKIIAVTMHTEKVFLLKLIEAGFLGCVFKSDVFNQLYSAIQSVMKGQLFIPDDIPIK